MPKASFKFSQLAQQHLVGIKRYTVEQFGEALWLNYKAKLLDGFTLLAENPALGKPCEEIYPTGFYYPVGKHMAYYTKEKHAIVIVAVLAQSQLPQNHLNNR